MSAVGDLLEKRETWARRWKALAKVAWRYWRKDYVVTLRARRSERALLECSGCGLRNTIEPTVRERIDGGVRCNDCARKWEGVSPPRVHESEWRVWLL